ncbi:MAG: DUF4493 domain-containing protein, partial [Rikenellaceae bacterium]
MKTILKRFIYSLFIIMMSMGCSEDNKKFDEVGPDGNIVTRGYVSLAKIDITVDISTKGESITKAGEIDTKDFIVTIINKKDNSVAGEWKKSEMPEKVEVYTGDYTVKVVSMKNHKTAAWEQPYYTGSRDFKVSEGVTTIIEPVVCKL